VVVEVFLEIWVMKQEAAVLEDIENLEEQLQGAIASLH
tara:strand:+ start:35 stop:148 length:114 start_codon:yes stop_codon:yes gene_type:complete